METNRWGEDIISKTIYYNDVLEIYTAGITNPNPDYRIMHNICPEEMHFDYYVFEYVLSGVGYIETPEKTYTVSEGDMYFLNKLRYHDYYPDKKNPFKKEFVVVRGALADKMASLYKVNDSVIIRHVDVHYIFEKLFYNMEHEEQIPNDEIENLVFQLFQTVKTPSVSKQDQNLASRIADYLYVHIQEKITVEELSRDLYISTSTAQHVFAKKYQCSLMKYFMTIKLEYAKMLLRTTKHSVAHIAHCLAFDDEKYFSRCFKKEVGMTPRQYRESHSTLS